MRTRLVVALLLVLTLVLPAQALDYQFVYKNATLSTTSTNVPFGFGAQAVLVQNRNAAGGTRIYIDWLGQTATAADYELDGGAAVSLTATVNSQGGLLTFSSITVACVTGTCDVQVLAKR